MKRKDHILETAFELFNKKGLHEVSTYDIANKLKISQGNLTYHFPTKRDLINTLAKNMISEIDEIVLTVEDDFSFVDFYRVFEHSFTVNIKYHFLYMNYATIVLSDANLNAYFLENSESRKLLLRKILETLVTNDYITPNSIVQLNDKVEDIINLIAIYWVPQAEIYHNGKTKSEVIHHYIGLIFVLFTPYLTTKGKENFKEIPQLEVW